jgi:hypothetical protein
VTPPAAGGYWHAGGRLVRIALLLPLIVGFLLATSIASVAVTSTATGLDAENRGWFFLMVPPIQLLAVVGGTAYLASLYVRPAALPRLASMSAAAATSIVGNVVTAIGVAVGGTMAVLVAVPVQVLLTTWLIMRPDLYSDVEKVIIGVETTAVALWLVYLTRGLLRGRSRGFRHTRLHS